MAVNDVEANRQINRSNKSRLSIMSWNIRGIITDHSVKCNQLQNYLDSLENPIHVVCIQETKLKTKSKPFKFKGYQKPINKLRPGAEDSAAGGLCIYVRNGITFKEKSTRYSASAETLAITIIGKNEKYHIYNYYAKNSGSNKYTDMSNLFTNLDENTIITGDFNLKHTCWNPEGDYRSDAEADDLIDFMNDNDLNFLNDGQITRIAECANQLDSALDLSIISAHLHHKSEFLVVDNTFGSDHLPIITEIKAKLQPENIILLEKWLVDKAKDNQWSEFRHLCLQELSYNILDIPIDDNFNEFLTKLQRILIKTIPKSKSKTVKSKTPKNWWNPDCTQAIKHREKCRRNYKADKTPLKYELWRTARRDAKNTIKIAKRESWEEFCSKITHKTNSKELWGFTRKVKGSEPKSCPAFMINNTVITDPKEKQKLWSINMLRQVVMKGTVKPSLIESKLKIRSSINL
ncbi:uncharacterized protein LOC128556622 [Mercenaria mercenaria]|uniref:uncharacterized protein LOC128556622 n=1 Tax=Mercenaria mercenaria TaxID=6596 RepID=UPI00234E7A31|nr:uncharacterized protein LOC128556622 [Mercenaria mercenaria]